MRSAPCWWWCALLIGIGAVAGRPARAAPAIESDRARVLGELDARALRTGILYDRVLPLSHIERYDGSEQSRPASRGTWRQLYDELRRASTAPAQPELEFLVEQAHARARQEIIPLALLDYRYERIRPDALGWIQREGRLPPGEGDPFIESRAFAAAALQDRTYRGGEVVFALDRPRCFTNEGMPRRLQVDFDDGRGYRAIRLGEESRVRYAETGLRTLKLNATLADGSTLHAAFTFTVAALQTPTPDDTLHITAAVPYQGQYGTGEAYVYLAPSHAALLNPVIVAEGFDIDNTMNWDELYQLLNQQGLIETLRNDGYDAVVLNFGDATDYMQKNAFVLTELLQEVKAAVGPQATVALVGASMGGLVSRYALAYLESSGIAHQVRTFISFDAPHAGADIPLGIQYWMKFFSSQSADAAHLLGRLDRPAARQMLVYHYTDPPGSTGQSDPLRAALAADLTAIGDFPAGPRLVAVANGSGSRLGQGFAPGDQIILYEYSPSIFLNIIGDVWAVPDATSRMIFNGRIHILLSDTRQSVTVSGTRPLDNAPGGSRATMTQMDTTAAPYGDIVALHPSHCFIPTISALALDTTDLFYDVAGDPDLLAHTPFDAAYYPATNQEHVTITPENAVWFRNEIENGVTGVPAIAPVPAAAWWLAPGVPNPFRASTRVRFTLPAAADVELKIFGLDGREVGSLARGAMAGGPHEVLWRGRDGRDRPVPPGVYFVRLRAGTHTETLRVVKIE